MIAGDLFLDVANGVLRVGDDAIALRPKPLHLLQVLMQNQPSLMTKEQLLDEVWNGVVVSEAVLTTAMKELRQALKDSARSPTYIETVHRRGYRFLLPVTTGESSSQRTVILPEASKQNTHRVLGLMTCIVIAVAALLIFGGYPSKQENIEALAVLALSDAKQSQPNQEMFLTQLEGEFSRYGILSSGLMAQFTVELEPISVDGSPHLKVAIQGKSQQAPVLHSSSYTRSNDSVADSQRIALLVSELLRCVQSVQLHSDEEFTASQPLTAQLFELCSVASSNKNHRDLASTSEKLWRSAEENPTAQAIHSAILSATPSQFLFGQRDDENRRLHNRARDLANRAEELRPGVHTDIALALFSHLDTSLWVSEQELLQAPTDSWLGAFVNIRRALLLRATGRMAEASRLYRTMNADWPAWLDLYIHLALVETAQGDHEQARTTISAGLALQPEAISISRLQSDLTIFYGSKQAALDIISGEVGFFPPTLAPCAKFFIEAKERGGAHPDLIDEALCEEFDVTRQARIRAILGDFQGAVERLEMLDSDAKGISVVFFYREFAPLFNMPRFWNILQKFGLVEYWQQSNTVPDVCRDEARIVFCRKQIAKFAQQSLAKTAQ